MSNNMGFRELCRAQRAIFNEHIFNFVSKIVFSRENDKLVSSGRLSGAKWLEAACARTIMT